MKQHFQTKVLMAGSDLFPSCTMVNSPPLHVRLLFVFFCGSVMQSSAGTLPRTRLKYPRTHKDSDTTIQKQRHEHARTHADAAPRCLQTLLPTHLDFSCSPILSKNMQGLCVGGLFFFRGSEDGDVTKEPQLQPQHMLSVKFQPSGQSLFIARRKQ